MIDPKTFGVVSVPDVKTQDQLHEECGKLMARELLQLPKEMGIEPALLLIRDKAG